MKKTLLLLIVLLFMLSCETTGVISSGALFLGKVYSSENKPVQGVKIIIDEITTVYTDIDGKFAIPALPFGSHTILIEKDGYFSLSKSFQFETAENVFHGTIYKYETAITQLADALAKDAIEKAKQLYSLVNASQDERVEYLKSIYALKVEENPQKSISILEDLYKSTQDDYVLLTIADIYQFYLNDKSSAKELLQMVENPSEDIQNRLVELNS